MLSPPTVLPLMSNEGRKRMKKGIRWEVVRQMRQPDAKSGWPSPVLRDFSRGLLAAAEDFAEARQPGDDRQGEALECWRQEKKAT